MPTTHPEFLAARALSVRQPPSMQRDTKQIADALTELKCRYEQSGSEYDRGRLEGFREAVSMIAEAISERSEAPTRRDSGHSEGNDH